MIVDIGCTVKLDAKGNVISTENRTMELKTNEQKNTYVGWIYKLALAHARDKEEAKLKAKGANITK